MYARHNNPISHGGFQDGFLSYTERMRAEGTQDLFQVMIYKRLKSLGYV